MEFIKDEAMYLWRGTALWNQVKQKRGSFNTLIIWKQQLTLLPTGLFAELDCINGKRQAK